jgi:hypothetical protein
MIDGSHQPVTWPPLKMHPNGEHWERERLALDILDDNFVDNKGLFKRKDKDYEMTDEEYWALRYLIEEWDYDYTI